MCVYLYVHVYLYAYLYRYCAVDPAVATATGVQRSSAAGDAMVPAPASARGAACLAFVLGATLAGQRQHAAADSIIVSRAADVPAHVATKMGPRTASRAALRRNADFEYELGGLCVRGRSGECCCLRGPCLCSPRAHCQQPKGILHRLTVRIRRQRSDAAMQCAGPRGRS